MPNLIEYQTYDTFPGAQAEYARLSVFYKYLQKSALKCAEGLTTGAEAGDNVVAIYSAWGKKMEPQILIEEVVTQGEARRFHGYSSQWASLGVYRVNDKGELSSAGESKQALDDVTSYYEGRKRQYTTSGQEKDIHDIEITIRKNAWEAIQNQDTSDPKTIIGILSMDPILILNNGQGTGTRCIKPEPYGWIFSTNSSVRLIDPTVPVFKKSGSGRGGKEKADIPSELDFTLVKNVK